MLEKWAANQPQILIPPDNYWHLSRGSLSLGQHLERKEPFSNRKDCLRFIAEALCEWLITSSLLIIGKGLKDAISLIGNFQRAIE